jgi:hypothetical protein
MALDYCLHQHSSLQEGAGKLLPVVKHEERLIHSVMQGFLVSHALPTPAVGQGNVMDFYEFPNGEKLRGLATCQPTSSERGYFFWQPCVQPALP